MERKTAEVVMASWYQLISVRISPFSELGRWVLERQGIAYRESCHAPILNVPFTWAEGRSSNVPVVSAPDATFEVREFLHYIDRRASGRFHKLIYEGPFPDRLAVEFGGTA
jgi:hypothetical protein